MSIDTIVAGAAPDAASTIANTNTPSAVIKRRPLISPLNQRRWNLFKQNKRGWWSLWIFAFLCLVSIFADVIANDRPIVASYKGHLMFPVLFNYPDSTFGGKLATADFRDPLVENEIKQHGWAIWPPIHYSYNTISPYSRSLAPPFWLEKREQTCELYENGVADKDCKFANWHLLGTDDQTRDIFTRVLYGFRVSLAFTVLVTFFSAVLGVAAGAIQGYFGGLLDLVMQRLIEIWYAIPGLLLIIVMASIFTQSFWILLLILVSFQWIVMVGLVRAEFLRARNFEYVTAARALGASNRAIITRHLLPNAMVATLTYLPFLLTSSISILTSLDYLGFGLPPGSASLGEIIRQAARALTSPWIGITAFVAIALMLSLLAFVGEAVRGAFDPRKTFQ